MTDSECLQALVFLGAAVFGLLAVCQTRGRWWVLALLLSAGSVRAGSYFLTIINQGSDVVHCGWTWAAMTTGWPDYPASGGIQVNPGADTIINHSVQQGTVRYAYSAIAYAENCEGQFVAVSWSRGSYYGQDFNKSFIIYSTPRGAVPAAPVVTVPFGWPNGSDPMSALTMQMQLTSRDGHYVFDCTVGAWVWVSYWTNGASHPPVEIPPWDTWVYGVRPGGSVMSPNPEGAEWYVVSGGQSLIVEDIDYNTDGIISLEEQALGVSDAWGNQIYNAIVDQRTVQLAQHSELQSIAGNTGLILQALAAPREVDFSPVVEAIYDAAGTPIDLAPVVSAIEDSRIESASIEDDFGEGEFDPGSVEIQPDTGVDEVLTDYTQWSESLPSWLSGVGDYVFQPLFGTLPNIGRNPVAFDKPLTIPLVGSFNVRLDFSTIPGIDLFRACLLLFMLIGFTFAAGKLFMTTFI